MNTSLLTWHRARPYADGSRAGWFATFPPGVVVARARRTGRPSGYWNTWEATGPGLTKRRYFTSLREIKEVAERHHALMLLTPEARP